MTSGTDVSVEPPPLSVAQEGMWYRSVLAPTTLTYNETISIRKAGDLDPEALRLALEEFVGRHEAWRSTFEVVDGRPVQVVHDPPRIDLPIIDLSALRLDEAERRAVSLIAEASRVPYDLATGPLVRPRLFRFPGEHHRLYLAMHHLVFDGFSLTRVVLPELIAIYDALAAGERPALPDPAVSYSDYARWEQRWIEEPRTRRRLEHWREHLGGAPALELPHDHARPGERRLGGGAIPLSMPRDALDRLRALGRDAGATLFQVLAASWSLLMARAAGQTEVVFATAAVMRQRPEFQGLVGCCLTPLVLRVEIREEAAFTDLVIAVRNELLDGLDQIVPFERVVRELPPGAGDGANPVYQTMIVLEPETDRPDPSWSLNQIDSALVNAVGNFKLDLELQLEERPDGGLGGELIYDRDLFEESTARRLIDEWLGLCAAIGHAPDATVASISTLPASERRRQVVEWNATTSERAPVTLGELIAARGLSQPDNVALADRDREVTYAEAVEAADRIAARLARAGVTPGAVVAVVAEPSVGLALGALGTMKAGAAHLLIDPGLGSDDVRRVMEVADATTALAGADARDRLDAPGVTTVSLDGPDEDPTPPTIVGIEAEWACAVVCRDSRALAMSHDAAANLATWLASTLDFSPQDTVLALGTSLFRSPVIDLWLPLVAGARVVLAPAGAETDGGEISRIVSAENVSFLHAAPSAWQTMIDTGLAASRSLRAVSGGEPLASPLAEALLDRCRVLWNAYEFDRVGYCTVGRVERSGPVTIGRPIANLRAYVLDDGGQPAGIGAGGDLIVAADRPPLGVLGGASEAGFDDPFAPGVAYRTGDRARWLADGTLELV